MNREQISRRLAVARWLGERVALTFKEEWGATNTRDSRRIHCYLGVTTGETKAYVMLRRRDSVDGYIVDADELERVEYLGVWK